MILGSEKLLELVREAQLVVGLAQRELEEPEGAGFDLRVGEIYRICGNAFLGVDERDTPQVELIAKYEEGSRSSVTIGPGDYYLVKTIEEVNTPDYITINLQPRTTTFRSGLMLRTGNVAPGYHGGLIFGLKNDGPCEVVLELGARIVHAQFYLIEGTSSNYRGQWQGGRVTTAGFERQI